ncbi:MAG: outer membrane beta-barrel protein, partial [Candidatus Aminicenantales bacterium]
IISFACWAHAADFKIMAGLSVPKSTGPVPLSGLEFSAQPEYGTGLAAGGGIEFSLTRNISLEIDALYIQKGSALRISEGAAEPVVYRRMARIDEFSVPVLFKAFLLRGNSPYVLGGGEFALVLTEGPRNMDYGLVGGIGYRRQLKGLGVSFEARYHHGFQDMLAEGDLRPELSANLRKMRAFAFVVGLTI